MSRWLPVVLLLPVAIANQAQVVVADTAAALTFNHAYSVPLARAQVFDAALRAWAQSFGREPGAGLGHTDRENGVIEGTARIKYRGVPLTAREETMGVISYRVMIQAGNGECTVMVTHLVHTGNRGAMNGGMDFGVLTGGIPEKHPGVSHRNAQRICADMRTQSTDRITALLNAFGASLRMAVEP